MGQYCKSAVPATIIVMVVATVGNLAQILLMERECDSMELKKQLIISIDEYGSGGHRIQRSW